MFWNASLWVGSPYQHNWLCTIKFDLIFYFCYVLQNIWNFSQTSAVKCFKLFHVSPLCPPKCANHICHFRFHTEIMKRFWCQNGSTEMPWITSFASVKILWNNPKCQNCLKVLHGGSNAFEEWTKNSIADWLDRSMRPCKEYMCFLPSSLFIRCLDPLLLLCTNSDWVFFLLIIFITIVAICWCRGETYQVNLGIILTKRDKQG